MTRARPTSYGVVTPPPLHRWMHAVLMLVVCLVQGVVATFGMRRWIGQRDWHAQSGTSALPQTKPDIHLKDPTAPTESLRPCAETLCWKTRRDSQTIPSKPSTGILGTSPRMTPARLKYLRVHWKRATWHAPRRTPGSSQRATRAPHTHNPSTVIPAEARRAGTQGLRAPAPATPGFRLALARVRNDKLYVPHSCLS